MDDITTITFICPTRNRPGNISRLVESVYNTCYEDNAGIIGFLFYVDIDDLVSELTLKKLQLKYGTARINYIVGDRIIMCEMSNILARQVSEGILFFCGDDIVLESLNWDLDILNEFKTTKDKILLVYGDDGLMHERLATHFFIHTNWIKTLGYIVPPIFTGDWADNYVTDVATTLGRKVYLPNVKTTHYHPTIGKAQFDATYIEKYSRDVRSNPAKVFNDSKVIRDQDVSKLKEFIKNHA